MHDEVYDEAAAPGRDSPHGSGDGGGSGGGEEGDFLRCPNCGLPFELTWRRYMGSPFGRHECPFCRASFRLKKTLASYVPLFATGLLVQIATFWATYLVLRDWGLAQTVAAAAAVAVMLPLDKSHDARLGKPTPLDEKRGPRPL